MAKRDVLKIAESVRGKIPERYDLTTKDADRLKDILDNSCFDGIEAIFRAGFVLGARAQKAGKFKV